MADAYAGKNRIKVCKNYGEVIFWHFSFPACLPQIILYVLSEVGGRVVGEEKNLMRSFSKQEKNLQEYLKTNEVSFGRKKIY